MNHNSIPSHSQNQILLYFPILYGAYIRGKISLVNRIETRAIEEMCLMGPINVHSIRRLIKLQFLSGVFKFNLRWCKYWVFLQWIKCQKMSKKNLPKNWKILCAGQSDKSFTWYVRFLKPIICFCLIFVFTDSFVAYFSTQVDYFDDLSLYTSLMFSWLWFVWCPMFDYYRFVGHGVIPV